ncbi:MAG: damage-inducible mutagenesis protein [Alphaproteobacteria bacterium]|nr:damage-inducible mutagenesis protein [Alphaproteobacteria bacterium]
MSGYHASLFRDARRAPPPVSAAALRGLRAEIARIERSGPYGAAPEASGIALDLPAVDAAFPPGVLARAALHEISGGAAHGFALRLLARRPGPVLWVHPVRRAEALYGPGVEGLGGGLAERLMIARARSAEEGLWAAEEGLRSGALSAVALEPDKAVGLTASRRLQLAAERGGALCLILPGEGAAEARLSHSAAASRWRVDPAPADVSGPATVRRWDVRLLRRRGGGAGAWRVEAGA